MGSSLSYQLYSEETAFSIIDTTGSALVDLVQEQQCNDNTCQRLASEKVSQMCEKFSPGQLAWTCQRLGISGSSCQPEDMSNKIVEFYLRSVEKSSSNDSQQKESRTTQMYYREERCPQCPQCPPVQVHVETPAPLIYTPTPKTDIQRAVIPVHTIQGVPKAEPKRIQVSGEEISKVGDNVIVRNPQSLKVTQTVPRSKLNEFSRSLGPNTKITSLTTIPNTQNIPRGTPVRALGDHIPRTVSELGLRAGQKTTYLEPAPRNWALVRHDEGSTGYVPATHLSL